LTEPVQTQQKICSCPHCPCIFVNEMDLFLHTEAFGEDPQQHLEKWKKTHRQIEYGYGEGE